jgi:hypothetical protein
VRFALADVDLERAMTAFSAGEPSRKIFYGQVEEIIENDLPTRDGLARVASARGDFNSAVREYRRLVSYGNEHHWVSGFEPRYVLEIARLLDRSGDKKAAKQEYERFLVFWKDADPDLPELAEARQVLAHLASIAPIR